MVVRAQQMEQIMRRLTFAVPAVAAVIVAASAAFQSRISAQTNPGMAWLSLPDEEKHPTRFEPFLKAHPRDETRRSAAVVWYQRKDPDLKKLKHHTLLLAEHHPGNMHILFSSVSAFYADPGYSAEVSTILERHVELESAEACTYWMLGEMCERAAIPPEFDDERARKRFLRSHGLPEDTPLSNSLDTAKAGTAATYYRRAMQKADEYWHHTAARSVDGYHPTCRREARKQGGTRKNAF